MEEKKEWAKCPKCSGFIPKTWSNHRKCGWNAEDQHAADFPKDVTAAMSQSEVTRIDLSKLPFTDLCYMREQADALIKIRLAEIYSEPMGN
jgi:hypothetical protein